MEASEHSAVLKAPLGHGGVMMAIYLLDLSKRYHGNPAQLLDCPQPGAWAFRATPYATVHGATWAQRMLNVIKCYTWLLYTANYFICVADGKIPRGAPQCFARGRTDGYEASGTSLGMAVHGGGRTR